MSDKDYSSTPLWKKLDVKEGGTIAIVRAPGNVPIQVPPGVERLARPAKDIDVILFFETRLARLQKSFPALRRKLAPAGGLWIAYPKKSSAIVTNLTFENVQAVGLDEGLVDNKICAIDGNWSAVRFVYRVKDRPSQG